MRLKGRDMHEAQKNRSVTERERAMNKAVSKVRYAETSAKPCLIFGLIEIKLKKSLKRHKSV